MNIWPNDFIYGEFRASDMGLIPGRFDGVDFTEDSIGMGLTVNEQFIGNDPVPVHLGVSCNEKLLLTICLMKNPCVYDDDAFNEYEIRTILRKVSRKYQWTKIINEELAEDIWFKCILNGVSYNRLGNKVVGITLSFECDSMYGWSILNTIRLNVEANKPFYVFNNTDELEGYVLPVVTATLSESGNLLVKNLEEDRASEILNIESDEVIVMDCKNKILTSSEPHELLLNDFNMNWIRLIPDKNTFVSNIGGTFVFEFRVPRKVGVVG